MQAERRDEQRRRGDAKTQTSDARFDEQFRFANRLYGQAAMPWWVGGWVGACSVYGGQLLHAVP